MQAYLAQELSDGSIKNKGLWFKIRLCWFCGILNKKIEREAEHTSYTAEITVENESVAEQYFKVMARLYEKLGYIVYYNTEIRLYERKPYKFVVCWDLKKHLKSLPSYESEFYRDYDYYTDCSETRKKEAEPIETAVCDKERSGSSNEWILKLEQTIKELEEREKEHKKKKQIKNRTKRAFLEE